jgi:hypothetical protein
MLCLYYCKGVLGNHFNELCENIFGLSKTYKWISFPFLPKNFFFLNEIYNL